jgi:hypothetical protein
MPSIDIEAARRDARRAYLKGLKRGDIVYASAPMSRVMMKSGGRMIDVTPEPSAASSVDASNTRIEMIEAERKAREHADWEKEFERKYLSGW